MANLSDLTGGSSTGAPDGGSVLLSRVLSGRGAYDYTPGTTLAAGKYAVKCSSNSRGIFRVSGNGNNVQGSQAISGWDWRGSENQGTIELPSAATTISMAFEPFDKDPAPQYRPLPQFYPHNSGYTGTATLNSNTYSMYGSSSMMASTPDGKIQVFVGGYNAIISASRDYGNTWHNVGNYNNITPGAYTNETYSVEYFNGRFLVAGGPNTNYGLVSNNGFDWEYSGDGNWTTVRCAAVSPTGYIYGRNSTSSNVGFSPDGQSFTLFSPSGLIGNVTAVAWDGTNYLAFDDGSRMATSTDGSLWNSAYSIPFICRSVVKLGSTWWAISQAGQLYYSSNLTSWTAGSTLSGSTYYNHRLVKNGSVLVYYDPVNGQIKTSTDGISWWIRADGLSQFGTIGMDALGKMWYRQENDASSYYAPAGNPIAWSRQVHPNQTTAINTMAYGVGSSGARWVAGGNTGTIMSAPDGYTWTERTSTFTAGNNFVSNTVNAIQFYNNRFLAVGGAGVVAYSVDGDNWIRTNYNANNVISAANTRAIAFGAGLYVVGNDSGIVYSSPDMTTWTQRQTLLGGGVYEITFANSLFVAVCAGGYIYSSTDGITWTQRSRLVGTAVSAGGTFEGQYVANNLNGVSWGVTPAYPSGLWIAVGDSGVTLRSTDGLDWRTGVKTSAMYQSGQNTRSRYAIDRHWVTGNNGYLAWTQDGEIFWQISSGHIAQTVRDVATNGTLVQSVAFNGQITFAHTQPGASTNDYNTWTSFNINYTPSTQYQSAYSNGIYTLMNANGIWRTYDWIEFLPYVYNRVSQNNYLSDVMGGNGMFVARSEGTNYMYFSPDGNRWCSIRKYGRNLDSRCTEHSLSFEDGFFYKYYTGNNTIARSADGITWYNYHTFVVGVLPASLAPTRIKKTGNTWFAWHTSTSAAGYWMFNQDFHRQPRRWAQGYFGTGGQGIWDIAATDDVYIFCGTSDTYTSNNAMGTNAMTVRLGSSNATFGVAYKAFDIGGKLFAVKTDSYLYEIWRDQGDATTTASTVYFASSMYTTQLADNSSQYSFRKSANYVGGFYSSQPIDFITSTPVTFSIYSSTIATGNY